MQVTVSKDDTVILDGAGDKKAIEERAELVCSILNYLSLLSSVWTLYYMLITAKFV